MINRRAFEAAHPALINFGRAMSGVTQIMHAASTAMNAVNIVQLLMAGTTSAVAEQQAAAERAQRDYNDAIREFGADSPQAKDALSKWNIELTKLKELTAQKDSQWINNIMTLGINIAFVGSTMATALPRLIPYLAGLTSLAALAPALGLVAGIIGGLALREAFPPPSEIDIVPFLDKFFQQDLPKWFANAVAGAVMFGNALVSGFRTAWVNVISFTNAAIHAIASGIESLANAFVDAVNGMIRAANRMLGAIGLPKLNLIGKISIAAPNIPAIAAAEGFEGMVNRPTLFLAGERGSEAVSISPSSSSNTSSSSQIIYNNFAGSLLTERMLYQINARQQKRELLRRNFRSTSI